MKIIPNTVINNPKQFSAPTCQESFPYNVQKPIFSPTGTRAADLDRAEDVPRSDHLLGNVALPVFCVTGFSCYTVSGENTSYTSSCMMQFNFKLRFEMQTVSFSSRFL